MSSKYEILKHKISFKFNKNLLDVKQGFLFDDYYLNEKMKKWMDENILNDYICYGDTYDSNCFNIWFETEKDALFFKLSWL